MQYHRTLGMSNFHPGLVALRRTCVLALLLGMLSWTSSISAQPAAAPDSSASHLEIIGGLGTNYGFNNETSFSELLSVRFEFGDLYLGGRYLHSNGSISGTVPDETIDDFGILAGYSLRFRLFSFSGGVGISYESFVTRGKFIDSAYSIAVGDLAANYEQLHAHSIGVPIEVDALWTPSSYLGVGLSFFDTFGATRNSYGILAVLRATIY